jgi:hypothetical protein
MDVLKVEMMVLCFDLLLLESDAFESVIEQPRLLVSDDALSTCQLSLLMQESAQFSSDRGIRSRCIECKASHTHRIDARGGCTKSLLEVHCRRGRFQRFSRGALFCHVDSSSLDPTPPDPAEI